MLYTAAFAICTGVFVAYGVGAGLIATGVVLIVLAFLIVAKD